MTLTVHDEPGFHVRTDKRTLTGAIKVPSSPATAKVWTEIGRFDAIDLGITHLFDEIAGKMPSLEPDNCKTEWIKNGVSDPSKRTTREPGKETGWASNGAVCEDIQAEDLPLVLVIWQDSAGGDLRITKVVVKAHCPLAEIAGKLT